MLNKPKRALLVFLGLTLLFTWGNGRVQKGGILDDDVILREDDPARQMDRYVQAKSAEGFEGREFIVFVLNRSLTSAQHLAKVVTLTAVVKAAFGEGVLSLAEAPAYHDTGETLRDEPYITLSEITQSSFDLQEWQEKVARDIGVYGLLVGRDFSWTTVIRYFPPGYDEISEFRKTVEFLEGRTIPWWEWFWKRDIIPHDLSVGVGGWVMGRGLIDQGLNVDVLTSSLSWRGFHLAGVLGRAGLFARGSVVRGGDGHRRVCLDPGSDGTAGSTGAGLLAACLRQCHRTGDQLCPP